ncbi:hypothetical protein F2P56_013396 [Juglans regia]|uniref:Uncharacterized protein n=1 Tax=Juglans regia TaxID=51240 RepID=A0A833XPY6_JUGRE|nr:hypothetical protein F2P56_013396 [Juglans regia]
MTFSFITYFSTSTLLADCYRSPDPVTGKRNYTYVDVVRANLGIILNKSNERFQASHFTEMQEFHSRLQKYSVSHSLLYESPFASSQSSRSHEETSRAVKKSLQHNQLQWGKLSTMKFSAKDLQRHFTGHLMSMKALKLLGTKLSFMISCKALKILKDSIVRFISLRHRSTPNIMKFYTFWVDIANRNINFVTKIFTYRTLRQ